MDSLASAASVRCDTLRRSPLPRPPFKTLTLPSSPNPRPRHSNRSPLTLRASSASDPTPTPLAGTIRTAASAALVLAAASAALFSGRLLARADPVQETTAETLAETTAADAAEVELSPETVASLKSLAYQQLSDGEDAEALAILRRLIAYQPTEAEWKLLAARTLNEMGEATESRKMYEEILSVDPLSFEALFENAVLMDRCGEGDAVIERLQQALEIARSEKNEKSERDVRFIMAQVKYLQKNVDGALEDYEELSREDPKDFKPYFCQGVIFSLLERNQEAREKFAKYKELAPKDSVDMNAYLQTPLSRAKLFGTDDAEI